MILYASHITIAISLILCLVLVSVYLHFVKKNTSLAIIILIITAFIVRLLMASVDPYLHNWDERFHALVAKNLMDNPFKPMLRVNPIMPYKIENWCCNHIWVHKQPLFLWQMAISMKFFGINEIALRLPSVIMGTVSVYFIYDIAVKWVKNIDVAFVSALLFSISYYQLELTSGWLPLDQNDVAFAFYVTASIWAFVRYIHNQKKYAWAILIGIFVGCAVLIKWLTGVLVLGGMGLYLLMNTKEQVDWLKWLHLLLSIIVCIIVFLPWQVHIMNNFPIESSLMYEHNRRHIFEAVEGHSGSWLYHLYQMKKIYRLYLLIFIPIGVYAIISDKKINNKLSIAFFAMIVVIFAFFSFVVKTKMSAYTFPVNSLIWILISTGIIAIYSIFKDSYSKIISLIFIFLFAVYALQPWVIANNRSHTNVTRNNKIENTIIYKSLDLSNDLNGRVILNCKSFEDVELMFYKDVDAFHWYPEKNIVDSLIHRGYKFAAFKSHNEQQLPEYMYNNDIKIIDKDIQ